MRYFKILGSLQRKRRKYLMCFAWYYLVLEWTWDPKEKSPACDLSNDNRTVNFHSSYSSGTAAVRGMQPMTDAQYFFEIKLKSPVYGTDMVRTRNLRFEHIVNFIQARGCRWSDWVLKHCSSTPSNKHSSACWEGIQTAVACHTTEDCSRKASSGRSVSCQFLWYWFNDCANDLP